MKKKEKKSIRSIPGISLPSNRTSSSPIFIILSLYWSIDDETTHLHIHPHKISYLTNLKTYTYFVSLPLSLSLFCCSIFHLTLFWQGTPKTLTTNPTRSTASSCDHILIHSHVFLSIIHISFSLLVCVSALFQRVCIKEEKKNELVLFMINVVDISLSLSFSHTFSYWLLYNSIESRWRKKQYWLISVIRWSSGLSKRLS